VAVTAQRRNRDQSELTIEYTAHGDSTAMLAWVLGSLAAAFVMVRLRSFSLP
jgi:hypothetical protein